MKFLNFTVAHNGISGLVRQKRQGKKHHGDGDDHHHDDDEQSLYVAEELDFLRIFMSLNEEERILIGHTFTYVSFKQSFPLNVQALMKEVKSCPIKIRSSSVRDINILKKSISSATKDDCSPSSGQGGSPGSPHPGGPCGPSSGPSSGRRFRLISPTNVLGASVKMKIP